MKKLIKAIAYGSCLTGLFIMTLTFIMAYLNNNEINVLINAYHEANLELLILIICWFCVILQIMEVKRNG